MLTTPESSAIARSYEVSPGKWYFWVTLGAIAVIGVKAARDEQNGEPKARAHRKNARR